VTPGRPRAGEADRARVPHARRSDLESTRRSRARISATRPRTSRRTTAIARSRSRSSSPSCATRSPRYNTELGRRTETSPGRGASKTRSTASYAGTRARDRAPRAPASADCSTYVADRVTVDRRDGCVKLFKNRYWSDEVSRLKGTKVVLRYDPTESLHKSVLVYRLDGTLVARRRSTARRASPMPPRPSATRGRAANSSARRRISLNDAVSAFADTLIPKRKRA
jgi:hypothetical protein